MLCKGGKIMKKVCFFTCLLLGISLVKKFLLIEVPESLIEIMELSFPFVLGHTLWIQSSIGYNNMPGRKTNIFFGWGHHLPVHDPICSLGKQWVKDYTIYEPDGNIIHEEIDGEKNGGVVNIPYICKKEGTYRLASMIPSGYYTIYQTKYEEWHHFTEPLDTMENPDEVEKIGRYFVEERKLHTTIKLNPTLLGDQEVRTILNDKLGFKTQVPDLAFDHDLKYPDGVALIRSLLDSAKKEGVEFNIKLTNTLETTNKEQDLPDSEQMVYMSGRSLHPISINLARRLQDEFKGALDISFSAGTSYENIAGVLACNLKPITTCADLLKPG